MQVEDVTQWDALCALPEGETQEDYCPKPVEPVTQLCSPGETIECQDGQARKGRRTCEDENQCGSNSACAPSFNWSTCRIGGSANSCLESDKTPIRATAIIEKLRMGQTYTLLNPGNYCLADDVKIDQAQDELPAIRIQGSDISLDLSENEIETSNPNQFRGIEIADTAERVEVLNGKIKGFQDGVSRTFGVIPTTHLHGLTLEGLEIQASKIGIRLGYREKNLKLLGNKILSDKDGIIVGYPFSRNRGPVENRTEDALIQENEIRISSVPPARPEPHWGLYVYESHTHVEILDNLVEFDPYLVPDALVMQTGIQVAHADDALVARNTVLGTREHAEDLISVETGNLIPAASRSWWHAGISAWISGTVIIRDNRIKGLLSRAASSGDYRGYGIKIAEVRDFQAQGNQICNALKGGIIYANSASDVSSSGFIIGNSFFDVLTPTELLPYSRDPLLLPVQSHLLTECPF